ncbi:MAG: DUF4249 domain-containing protein [Bacteroidales bacterium]|nr:DUF4249 domain-containing protein [Bacteroidales bacterium]
MSCTRIHYINLLLFLFLTILFSCQKEIEVTLPDYDQKLVIEGSIENGEPAMVIVSNSVPYFATLDLNTLMNKVLVTDAVVTVTSSTGESEQLQLIYTDQSPVYIAYVGRNLLGEPGKSYTLKVTHNGQEYSAQTSIPQPVKLDSVWLGFMIAEDTLPTSRVQITDDANSIDYYQFRVKVHGKKLHDRLWVTSMPVAFNDGPFNGQTVTFEVTRSNPSSIFTAAMTDEEEEEFYRVTYRKGDTIYIKTSMIDYESYQFWSAMTYGIAVGQNPFMSPAPVPYNIHGKNVIGIWSGYGSTIDTLYYPE